MREKNRFSGLLKHLMTVAKLKNYTLAKELQYDESYISKWVTGSLLPTEKTREKVIRDISRCVVSSLDEEGRTTLYSEYQLDNDTDLQEAIFDNLVAEFNYVMDLKESTGSEIAQKTTFYPDLPLTQFIQKMRHPVLRQVKSLNVIMVADILSLDRHYQLALAEQGSAPSANASQRSWPGVHFSLMINLDVPGSDNGHNAQFLLNLLTYLSSVNFQLYTSRHAQGKIIFAVKDSYSISGMLMEEPHCLAVTVSEEQKNCAALYERLQGLCTQDALAVRNTTMYDMLCSNAYMQYTFARNQRWLLSHMTEHFLPDDLFEHYADEYCRQHTDVDRQNLTRMHKLSRNVLESVNIKLLIQEDTLSEFAVSGTVNFFNSRIQLTLEQRLQCLNHIAALTDKNPNLVFRILPNRMFSDSQHAPRPTLFLSDSPCYVRLAHCCAADTVSELNQPRVCDLFRNFFDDLWNSESLSDGDGIPLNDLLHYAMQMVRVQIQVET